MTPLTLSILSIVPLLALSAVPTTAAATASSMVFGNGWRFSPPPHPTRSRGLTLAATASNTSAAGEWGISADYESGDCSDAPAMVVVVSGCGDDGQYEDDGCLDVGSSGSSSTSLEFTFKSGRAECVADSTVALDALYGDQAYIRMDFYSDPTCSTFVNANVFVADGACHTMQYINGITGEYSIASKIAKIWDNGTASVTWFYNATDCSDTSGSVFTIAYSNEQQSSSECQVDTDGTSTIGLSTGMVKENDGGLSTGAIVGIVVACVVFLALVAGLVLWRRQRSRRSGGVDGVDGAALQAPETPDKDATPYQTAA